MHHTGLMLDMVTYIAFQLSIGLCVDYAGSYKKLYMETVAIKT